MGKFWAKHAGTIKSVITSTCLVGASAGIVFGVSAATFKVTYMNLNDADNRVKAANASLAYYSQDIKSQWNMDASLEEGRQEIQDAWWKKMHNNAEMLSKFSLDIKPNATYGETIEDDIMRNRYKYISMVIDGATHSTMDRSFNQSLYNGIVNYIKNHDVDKVDPETSTDPVAQNCASSFRPGADNTTEFLNIFASVAANYKAVALAGFNHVTPLNSMGEYDEASKLVKYKNPDFDKTGWLLIDGDVSKNQNVASVLFRADQPGFMTGIATSMYFINNLHLYHDQFQDLAIAAYGGTAIPTVTCYMGGVQRGIEFFNEFVLRQGILRCEKVSGIYQGKGYRYLTENDEEYGKEKYPMIFADIKKMIAASKNKEAIEKHLETARKSQSGTKPAALVNEAIKILNDLYTEYEVKMIKLGEGSTHFSGSFAAGDAIGITKQYLNRGAGAIIAVAGPQSLDSAQEIQNQNSKAIVIGVDTAMEDGDYQRKFNGNYEDQTVDKDGKKSQHANNIIKFSAVKDMKAVTTKFAQLSAKGANFDIENQHKWRHNAEPEVITPTQQDSRIIPNGYFEFSTPTPENTVTITGGGQMSLTEANTILKIPDEIETTNGTKCKVVGIGAGALNDPNLKYVKHIVFNTNENFSIPSKAFSSCINAEILDFRNIHSAGRAPALRLVSDSFTGLPTNYKGFVCINSLVLDDNKDKFITTLKENGLDDQFYFQTPDPEKSVCGVGYKTCGNIENGLISISKNGWVPFIQAMSHVWIGYNGTAEILFLNAWKTQADEYFKTHGKALEKELGAEEYKAFKDQVAGEPDQTLMWTFNQETPLYKHYDILMKMLAEMFGSSRCTFSFSPEMTVYLDASGKYVKAPKAISYSILQWLKLNMYFTV